MPYEIEGKTYYSLAETSRLIGIPEETILGWLSGRVPLKGLEIDVVRDSGRNQLYLAADAVRVLQHRNTFITPDPRGS